MTLRKIPLLLFLSAITFGISSKEPILLLKDTRERKVLEQGVQKRVRQVSQVGSEDLTWEVLISFPSLKKYQKIRWGGSGSISFSEDTIRFTTKNLTDFLILEGEGISPVRLQTTILTESSNCNRFGIQLKAVGAKLDDEPQLFCIESEEKILMYLYPSSQVKIAHSELKRNLSESQNWKSYWVKRENPSVCFPYLVLEKIKQKFPYFICGASEVLESEDQTKQSKLLLVSDENIKNFQTYDQKWTKLIWLGSGITNLSIHSSDRDFSDLKLLVIAKIQPGSIWKNIEMSAMATYAFPIHSSLESLSYSQLMGKISYGMSLSDSMKVKAGLNYQRIQFEDDTTRLGVAGGQLGIDMALLFPFSNSWDAELGFSMLPTSLGALSSSRIINLSLLNKRDRLEKYGFVFQYQDFELIASNLNPIKLTQLSLQFLFRF